MHSFSIPLIALVAFFGLAQAKGTAKTVCSTANVSSKGTRTSTLAPVTTTVTKDVACYTTSTSVVTPDAQVVTSIVASSSVVTVDAPQVTDTATSTHWLVSYSFPSTTTTSTSTPISTITSWVSNTNDPTTTVTSYTQTGTTAFNRRRQVEEGIERRGGKGKNVYCHKEVVKTTTVTDATCATITASSTVSPSTTTTTSTFTFSMTETMYKADAVTTSTVTVPTTVTAPTNTWTITAFAPTSTTTATSTSATTTNTAVVPAYSYCDPSVGSNYQLVSGGDDPGSGAALESYPSVTSAQGCCAAVAAVPNAIYWLYGAQTGCQAWIAQTASTCDVGASYFERSSTPADNVYNAGYLQCGQE